jgi:hypothetical protein
MTGLTHPSAHAVPRILKPVQRRSAVRAPPRGGHRWHSVRVLRTYHFVRTLLADSSAGLTVKRERAAQLFALAGAGARVGGPEQAVEHNASAGGCRLRRWPSYRGISQLTIKPISRRVAGHGASPSSAMSVRELTAVVVIYISANSR